MDVPARITGLRKILLLSARPQGPAAGDVELSRNGGCLGNGRLQTDRVTGLLQLLDSVDLTSPYGAALPSVSKDDALRFSVPRFDLIREWSHVSSKRRTLSMSVDREKEALTFVRSNKLHRGIMFRFNNFRKLIYFNSIISVVSKLFSPGAKTGKF